MEARWTPAENAGSARFSKRFRDGEGEDYASFVSVAAETMTRMKACAKKDDKVAVGRELKDEVPRAPGCDRDLGKRHHNDDRPVRRAEIEPLITRAICGRSNATAACRGVIL